MLYLASTGSDLNACGAHDRIGLMTSPLARGYSALSSGRPWASDCDALANNRRGARHSYESYEDHLERLLPHAGTCLFVVVPDVPGDAQSTLASYHAHAAVMGEWPFPLAYVMQDGAECLPLPDVAVAFLGGTDPWRRQWGASMLRRAREAGCATHVGRVNSAARMRALALTDCDSADGTYVAFRGVERGVREIGGWLEGAGQPMFTPAQVVSPQTPWETLGDVAEQRLPVAS